jgi:phosphoglycolate phosphatase
MTPGLIFDLDGTLVDSLPGIAASLNRALRRLGMPEHGDAAVRGFIGNGSYELARRALPADAGADRVSALESAFKQDYAGTWHQGTTPYAGIPELLQGLREAHHALAILSNKPHDFTVEIVARMFPSTSFQPVLGQRPELPRKPDPAGARVIARGWQLPPADCRFIGDSTVDLETARAAGMPFVAVGWGYHDPATLEAAGPDFLAPDPAALAAFFGID